MMRTHRILPILCAVLMFIGLLNLLRDCGDQPLRTSEGEIVSGGVK